MSGITTISGHTSKTLFIQLRPSVTQLTACLSRLDRVRADHPDATVDVAGLGRGETTLNLIVSVNLGPADEIAKPSDIAVTGFNFTQAAMEELFDYYPHFVAEPTAEQRAFAEQLPTIVATFGATQDLAVEIA